MVASLAPLSSPETPDQPEAAVLLQHLATLSSMTFADDATAIQTYLSSIQRLFQMHSVFVCEIADELLTLRDVAVANDIAVAVGTTVPLHQTCCQYVYADRVPMVVPDAARDLRVAHLPTRQTFAIGSYIGVPLFLCNGDVYGTLCAHDPAPHHITTHHVAFLQVIAHHIAALVERRQMHNVIGRADQEASTDLLNTLTALDSQVALMHVVAHDVRGPLMGIQGYAELLDEQMLGDLTPEQQDACKTILRSSLFVNRLMHDLLDMSSLKQQTMTLLAEEFDAVELAEHVVATYRPIVDPTRIRLESVAMTPTLPMTGDRDRVQQVLHNLLSNAVRYTNVGSIRVVVAPANEGVAFHVEDTGPGIASDLQATIWTRSTRGTTVQKGYGLGLYVVRHVVEAMDGTITLESEVGQGSRFIVWLPAQGASSQSLTWTESP